MYTYEINCSLEFMNINRGIGPAPIDLNITSQQNYLWIYNVKAL